MSTAENILAALGGAENVIVIEPCITRLRAEVEDPRLIDEHALKAAGAHGVLRSGTRCSGRCRATSRHHCVRHRRLM